MEHSREECLVFKNIHPTLITREVWDVVQRVRKNTRPRPWRLTTTALAMSAADSRMWKKHWKHRKPRTQRNPGRHRKHDACRGIQGITCYPCEGEQRLPCPFCPRPGKVYRQQTVKFFRRMPHSCEYHCAASGTATPPRRYSAASAHFARYDRASSNQTSCSVPPRQKL